ncbi:hypothetical protein [Hymenobacter convexus]|uniref:hypothetical protein n=1 Tax=Hymenobacter sp. CA1UV-4 TaxID=3063782 RepID=UPI0027128FD3|nr:hypothetical protein [Hymenobacter sp. CA1UV-4]MDO7852801.1 hypothetical protein [Hymenobacter sp. CA1UV-4]
MPFTLLSSRLTLAYKVVIPIVTLLGLGVYVVLIITQHWLLELHAVVAAFGLAMWLLFVLIISVRIRHVAYNESFIRVRNYGLWVQFPASEFIWLESSLMWPSRLRTSSGSYLFLPDYFGTLTTLIQQSDEPITITTARRILTKAKA